MKSRVIFFIMIIVLAANFGSAQPRPAFMKQLFVHERDSLPYRVLYPEGYNAKKKYPLIVFLHGSGARGNDNEAQLNNFPAAFTSDITRKKYPFILIVPQCPKNNIWVNFPDFPKSLEATDTATTPARLVLKLVDDLCKNGIVDHRRIYLTGYSMGGEGTFDMIARRPDLFAAAVSLCPVADTATAKKIDHIPLRVYHGSDDKVNEVIYSRIMITALQRAGGKPIYTEYAGLGHKIWDKAYNEPDLLPWLFSNVKKK